MSDSQVEDNNKQHNYGRDDSDELTDDDEEDDEDTSNADDSNNNGSDIEDSDDDGLVDRDDDGFEGTNNDANPYDFDFDSDGKLCHIETGLSFTSKGYMAYEEINFVVRQKIYCLLEEKCDLVKQIIPIFHYRRSRFYIYK